MSFMLLIHEPRGQRGTRTLDEGRALYDRMVRYGAGLKARGLGLGGDALSSDSEGACVTVRGGKRNVVDGPFAETKEMIGGFFLIDCKTMDEAIAIAAECPAAEWATVEVREIGVCYEDAK